MRPTKSLPGFESPAVGFEQPFEMLSACHDRVRRSLFLLVRLQGHVTNHGVDEQAKQAATDVLRYFNVAAPAHHEDEERHIVPALMQSEDADLRAAANRILIDHARISSAWTDLAPFLRLVEAGHRPDRQQFVQAVDRFVRVHEDHLALEDNVAFPGARAHHESCGQAAVAAIGQEMAQRRAARKPLAVAEAS
jgi:hemerythrin-like domain-containing protein